MKRTEKTKTENRRTRFAAGALAALSLLLAALVLAVCPVSGEEEIYGDVIRLHVLAASDREDDQSDKLAVRDAILSTYGDLFGGFSDRAGAEAALTPTFATGSAKRRKRRSPNGEDPPRSPSRSRRRITRRAITARSRFPPGVTCRFGS